MSDLSLCCSTGYLQTDRILQGIVGLYELVFPGYIRAYYVIGSYADASAVALSDIDVAIIFAKPVTSDQLRQAHMLIEHCASISPIRLDILLALETDMSGMESTLLKIGSRLVYGEDIRDRLALPPRDQYQRDVTWGPYRFLGQILREREVLVYPLTYPDATDPFYGYTKKRIASWYPADMQHGTKELITGITRTTTALLALRANEYVGSKHASVQAYRTHIGGAWVDYVETWY